MILDYKKFFSYDLNNIRLNLKERRKKAYVVRSEREGLVENLPRRCERTQPQVPKLWLVAREVTEVV